MNTFVLFLLIILSCKNNKTETLNYTNVEISLKENKYNLVGNTTNYNSNTIYFGLPTIK